jgi:tetratricopeptide (TPR) repeat protein
LPFDVRIENTFISYALYLKKMLWPDALAAFYPLFYPIDTVAVVVSVFVLLLISTGVFVFGQQRPYLVTGWLWYLGTLVPVIGLVQVGSQAMADRYTYVPLIGLFIILIWGVAEISLSWSYRRLVLTVLSVGMLATCWQLTAAQVRCWQNDETLSRHALALTANNAPMQVLLGNALFKQGNAEEAGEHFAEALRIRPGNVTATYNLAMALAAQGRLDEAADACQSTLKLQPRETKIRYLLGNLLSKQGKYLEAIVEYRAVLQIDPDYLFALNDLAWLLATAPDSRLRDGPAAVQLAEKACQLSKYQVTTFVGTLAAAYAESGRFDDAVKSAQNAVALAMAANNERLADRNRELLELYQQKKAWHEPASH